MRDRDLDQCRRPLGPSGCTVEGVPAQREHADLVNNLKLGEEDGALRPLPLLGRQKWHDEDRIRGPVDCRSWL
jgi:hypothetical protein